MAQAESDSDYANSYDHFETNYDEWTTFINLYLRIKNNIISLKKLNFFILVVFIIIITHKTKLIFKRIYYNIS